jgi:hypothetical protein
MVGGLTLQAVGRAWLSLVVGPDITYGELVVTIIWPDAACRWPSPPAENSVVGSVDLQALGKTTGTNSMMRELDGVLAPR